MSRPKTRNDLIDQSEENFKKLMDLVESLPEESRNLSGVCGSWSVKDILAHLHAWHMMCLTWYQDGITGTKPPMPAPGFTWKQTPDLNQLIYEEYQDEDYPSILASLIESHQQVMGTIKRHADEELFTKRLYAWTGSTSMASYFSSNTFSHYDWAIQQITKWQKSN